MEELYKNTIYICTYAVLDQEKSNCTPYGKLQRSTLVLKQCKVNKQRHNICLDAEREGGLAVPPTHPPKLQPIYQLHVHVEHNAMQAPSAYRKTPNNNNNKQAGVEGRESERWN